MAEARNFVEKELDKDRDEEKKSGNEQEIKPSTPTYTPPPQTAQFGTPPQMHAEPTIQIVEKIVYKKQRIHGFFRTLTILALLVIGFLMLGESTGIITLSVDSFKLHQIFPIFIIFSTIIIRSYRGLFGKIFGLILFLTVFGGIFTIGIYTGLNPSTKRKTGEISTYTVISTGQSDIYLETLIGNSYIEGSGTDKSVQTVWNSDRNLLTYSGAKSMRFIEDNNRNVLQNYTSRINLFLSTDKQFNLLYIKNLLGLHTIDLATFKRKKLTFHAGIDNITVRVGNVISGNKIEIQGPAANIDMDIPKDIAVNMYYQHIVGRLDAPEFYTLSGHYYQSNNIATAKATLNIFVNLGIGRMNINRVEPK